MGSKHYIDAHMRLHPGAVHIWRADLDAVGTQVERLLDEREQERAARIVGEAVRQRWMAARGLLRMLLGDYLEEHPRALRLAQEPGGKPVLDLPDHRRLHFNLSHSGPLAVYALTEVCAVGVDVELLARHPAKRTHSQDFLRTWVRAEAEGKRLGVGVGTKLHRARTSGSQPWIAELDLKPDAVGAIALSPIPVDFQVYPVNFRSYGSILPKDTTT